MLFNSSTVSHLDLENLKNADRYTNNASAVSIYSDLNKIVNSGRFPNEKKCELKKHSYTKNDLFKIRNTRSNLIEEQIPAVIAQSLAYKKNEPLDLCDVSDQLLSLKDKRCVPETKSQIGQEPGKFLLDMIRNSARPREEKNVLVPNKKKTDPLQQFFLDHPELLSEYSVKRKVCSALTVQEVESNLIIKADSAIRVQELESMQLNQTIYQDDISKTIIKDEMEVEEQLDQLDDQSEISVDFQMKKFEEKQHFMSLIEKLNK